MPQGIPSPSPLSAPRRGLVVAIGTLVAGVLIAFGALGLFLLTRVTPELPVLGEMPAFSFTNQDGEPVRDSDLRGHITVASFVFTRCPTVCPVVTMKVKRFEEQTRDLGPALRLVSFSVDPEYDTPERLAAFARRFGASTERWSFVTGPAAEMKARVEASLKIAMERRGELPGGVPDIAHGTHLVLLDSELRIRGYYDSDDAERLNALSEDARALVDELDR